jgi:hypothetical protein
MRTCFLEEKKEGKSEKISLKGWSSKNMIGAYLAKFFGPDYDRIGGVF